jgi:CRP-like cAMP-binding protein
LPKDWLIMQILSTIVLYFTCWTFVGKDDIFGEDIKKSYFDETRRIGKSLYTVRAISYCDLHKITIDDLQSIMDAYPEFAGDFIQNFGVTFNLREVDASELSSDYYNL